jgi:tRNA C32,U32 (ribose-2'-O)-methylase TrmJ
MAMTDQRTRNALNEVTDQIERLRAAIQEADDLETVEAFDDLEEALNDLKIAIGQTANHAPLAATGPESA